MRDGSQHANTQIAFCTFLFHRYRRKRSFISSLADGTYVPIAGQHHAHVLNELRKLYTKPIADNGHGKTEDECDPKIVTAICTVYKHNTPLNILEMVSGIDNKAQALFAATDFSELVGSLQRKMVECTDWSPSSKKKFKPWALEHDELWPWIRNSNASYKIVDKAKGSEHDQNAYNKLMVCRLAGTGERECSIHNG